MENFNRHICKCGKNLRELETKAVGVTVAKAGYPIDYYGGRVTLIKKDAVCECGRVMDLLFENLPQGMTIIDKVITKDKATISKKETVEEDVVVSKTENTIEGSEIDLNDDTDVKKEEVKETIKEVKKVSKK